MSTVQSTYLGWSGFLHATDCKKPSWDAQMQTESMLGPDARLSRACNNEDCSHGDHVEMTTFRLVCHSCRRAHVLTGEISSESYTTVDRIGYGSVPRKIAGLLLWPGQPWFRAGRASHEHPHDFLVTRAGVTRVAESDVVGCIYLWKGKLGGLTWAAAAVQDPDGTFAPGKLRWRRVSEGLRTPTAAAKFIAAEVAAADGER
ncbi:hypothetical protein [Streptomyces sp. Midd1]|uniref:hypothetical protein n=1 Tax=Streptomyces sp. Midd3 TaxID=3161191 RepID=UPI0034DB7A9B